MQSGPTPLQWMVPTFFGSQRTSPPPQRYGRVGRQSVNVTQGRLQDLANWKLDEGVIGPISMTVGFQSNDMVALASGLLGGLAWINWGLAVVPRGT